MASAIKLQRPSGYYVGGEFRNVEYTRTCDLRAQVVNFIRPDIVQQRCHARTIGQFTVMEGEAKVLFVEIRQRKCRSTRSVLKRKSAALQAVDIIPFGEK